MNTKKVKPLEIRDWDFLSGTSEVAMLQVAMERGLMGDIKSMKSMLDWFDLSGVPLMSQRCQQYETHVWAQMDDERHRKEVESNKITRVKIRGDEFYSTVYKSSFQAAIGIALTREPDERMEPIKQSDINALMAQGNPLISRTTPLDKEEMDLLDKAIEVWRRPVQDSEFNLRMPGHNMTAPGHAGLHMLFQSLGAHSVQDHSFRAFERAGFNDGQCLALVMRDAFPVEIDPKNLGRSLAQDLLNAGNLAGANWCLQAMLAVEDAPHYKVRETVKSFNECLILNLPAASSYVDAVMKDVKEQAANGTLTEKMTRKEAALVDLFWTMSSHKPSYGPETRMNNCMSALSTVLLSTNRASRVKPIPWRDEFVNAILDVAPTEEKTVRQHLGQWHQTLTSNTERSFGLTSRPEFHLINNAMRMHCTPVLEAAAPALAEAAKCIRFVGVPQGWPWGMSMLGETNQNLNPERFQKIIEIFQKSGMDFNRVFEYAPDLDEPQKLRKSSLVHLLAESKHQDTSTALVELLKAGIDTKVKNSRGWVPSSCLGTEDLKKEWMGIERAYANRKQAMDVLDELHNLVMAMK